LCGTSFSKSTVSELCKALDLIVREWNERSLEAVAYPFVIVDALQLKIRKGGCVIPQSAVLAVGVNAEGYREVLGLMIGDSESEASWSEFFTWLKQRGLTGVDLVVSDHHGGVARRPLDGARRGMDHWTVLSPDGRVLAVEEGQRRSKRGKDYVRGRSGCVEPAHRPGGEFTPHFGRGPQHSHCTGDFMDF